MMYNSIDISKQSWKNLKCSKMNGGELIQYYTISIEYFVEIKISFWEVLCHWCKAIWCRNIKLKGKKIQKFHLLYKYICVNHGY